MTKKKFAKPRQVALADAAPVTRTARGTKAPYSSEHFSRRTRAGRRALSAYHEAAHAVFAEVLGSTWPG